MKAAAALVCSTALAAAHSSSVVRYGPKGCVSVGLSAASSCVIRTNCEGIDTSNFDFAFDCTSPQGERQHHDFGLGGFDDVEEFDTGIKCQSCTTPGAAVMQATKALPHSFVVRKTHGGAAVKAARTSKTKLWTEVDAIKYGPKECVSVHKAKDTGHCIMQTKCKGVNTTGYEYGLICVNKSIPEKHVFGKNSFDPEETFDTLIACNQCQGLEDIEEDIALNGRMVAIAKEIKDLRKQQKNVTAEVEKLGKKVFPKGFPAETTSATTTTTKAKANTMKNETKKSLLHHRTNLKKAVAPPHHKKAVAPLHHKKAVAPPHHKAVAPPHHKKVVAPLHHKKALAPAHHKKVVAPEADPLAPDGLPRAEAVVHRTKSHAKKAQAKATAHHAKKQARHPKSHAHRATAHAHRVKALLSKQHARHQRQEADEKGDDAGEDEAASFKVDPTVTKEEEGGADMGPVSATALGAQLEEEDAAGGNEAKAGGEAGDGDDASKEVAVALDGDEGDVDEAGADNARAADVEAEEVKGGEEGAKGADGDADGRAEGSEEGAKATEADADAGGKEEAGDDSSKANASDQEQDGNAAINVADNEGDSKTESSDDEGHSLLDMTKASVAP